MGQKFTDNARALLTVSIAALDTSMTVEAAKADRFPVANTSDWNAPADWFKAVLFDSAGNREVVKVGTRTSGSNVLGNLQRAQDGTTALSFATGSVAMLAVVAKDVENALDGTFAAVTTGTIDATGKLRQNSVEGRFTPVGGIVMWSGSVASIPAGWALCDGLNGTPDLRDRFIIGARQDDAGVAKTNITGALTQTGGSKDAIVAAHTHAFSATSGTESADHTHSGTTSSAGSHQHRHQAAYHTSVWQGHSEAYGQYGGGTADDGGYLYNTEANGAHTHTITTGGRSAAHTHAVSGTTGSTGSAATNANLPPYYALAFIQCLAQA